jgi:uncharacterized protein (TIGR03437 family)
MYKIFFIATIALAQPVYTVQTVAGSDPLGDGGPATNAVIQNVNVVITDSTGNVYIAENQGRVRRVGTNGIISTVAGMVGVGSGGDGGPAVQAGLNVPLGLAIDSTGNFLYISDYQNCRIRRVTLSTGIIITFAGNGTCQDGPDGNASSTSLYYPTALVMDSQGRLVVAEPLSNRIRRIDTFGNMTTIAGDGTAGLTGNGGLATQALITSPGSLAEDAKGNLFFTDTTNCLIREIDASSGILHTIAGAGCGFTGDGGSPMTAMMTPGAILIDPAGDTIYMSDAGTRVRQINLGTNVITTYAGIGTTAIAPDGGPAMKTALESAGSLAFAADGSLLIAGPFGVREVSTKGILGTFAGIIPEAGDGGSAPNAILSYPEYVAPDGKGGFVFFDEQNARVRYVTSAGVISTVGGSNEFSGVSGDGGSALNAGFAFVRGITMDAAGNIYIAQGAFATASTFEVRRITPGGVIDKFGGTLALPTGLAIDPTQQFMYVSEYNGNRIVKVNLTTGATTTFAGQGQPGTTGTAGFLGDGGPASGAQFSGPGQLAVDGQGNVYVTDGGTRIRKISASGSLIQTIAGTGSFTSSGDGGLATQASISAFDGLAADSAGNVFLSEDSRIRRIDAVTGIINTVAGGSIGGFAGDGGAALSARFAAVTGINADSRGNIYLADLLNHRIRVLSPPGTTPFVTSIDTAGGFPDIAQNAWTEIKGANLGPAAGMTWASAPDFAMGRMPTQLGNISVTVNGNPAFIYYASATQINVLTPLDSTLGPVQVVVTNGGVVSLQFTATLRAAAPSFLLLGSTKYDAAEHTNGTLLGPASLSMPGYTFTPAQKGETIVLFTTGLGLPATGLTNGSSVQSGVLPTMPTVQIGGAAATVSFAGVISPGLYQLNVAVPSTVASGDNQLSVSYAGLTSPLGVLLSVQ